MSEAGMILVVEDDPLVLRSLTRLLRARGFGCVKAGSVEQALASSASFCGAIIDINLPDGCGLSLHEQLAAMGRVPFCVFFSATADPDEQSRAMKLGSFVAKSEGTEIAVDRLLDGLAPVSRAEPPRSGKRPSARATITPSVRVRKS